jgi:hypothetical protein
MVVIGNGCVLIIYVVDVMPPYRFIYLRWRSSFGGGVLPLRVSAGLRLKASCGDVGGHARGEKEREASGRVLVSAMRGGLSQEVGGVCAGIGRGRPLDGHAVYT